MDVCLRKQKSQGNSCGQKWWEIPEPQSQASTWVSICLGASVTQEDQGCLPIWWEMNPKARILKTMVSKAHWETLPCHLYCVWENKIYIKNLLAKSCNHRDQRAFGHHPCEDLSNKNKAGNLDWKVPRLVMTSAPSPHQRLNDKLVS